MPGLHHNHEHKHGSDLVFEGLEIPKGIGFENGDCDKIGGFCFFLG